MATPFIGLNVEVKLKSPPSSLHGHVVDVEGHQLFLRDVLVLRTGKRLSQRTIHAAEIEDIEVLSNDTPKTPTAPTSVQTTAPPPPTQAPQSAPRPPSQRSCNGSSNRTAAAAMGLFRPAQLSPASKPSFVDPAILSYNTSPAQATAPPTGVQPPPSELRAQSLGQQPQAPYSSIPTAVQSPQFTQAPPPHAISRHVSASLSGPFDAQDAQPEEEDTEAAAESQTVNAQEAMMGEPTQRGGKRTKTRRARRKKKQEEVDDNDSSPEATRKIGHEPAELRQAVVTQAQSPQATNRTPGLIQGKAARDALLPGGRTSKRRQRDLDREASKNGWGTEDATDVKDMGDFDFADGLSKFDKKAVWEELRAGDTTADEDRLVSFNRVKAPGTFGGQKLHPTENVLGGSRKVSQHEPDDTESDLDPNASSSSRRLQRDHSRASLVRQPPLRKDSSRFERQAPASASMVHSSSRQKLTDRPTLSPGLASPPSSTFSPSATYTGSFTTQPHLYYASTNRPSRTTTPETLQAIENLAHNGFAMPENTLAENAGRGIAEVILSTVDPGGLRLSRSNHNAPPVIVMLIGETKAGARALAAARHLLERNVRVIASLTGSVDLENGPLSAQVQRFRGKVVRSWSDTSTHLKTLDVPPELIVDAILGACDTFEDMNEEHFATAVQMLQWANQSKAAVLAVDVPSGVDPTTGVVQMREGEPLEIRAKVVVCCGIPVVGLVEAMAAREDETVWRVFVVDIGLNPAARPFMKMRTQDHSSGEEGGQRGRFVQFERGWVVGLGFEGGR